MLFPFISRATSQVAACWHLILWIFICNSSAFCLPCYETRPFRVLPAAKGWILLWLCFALVRICVKMKKRIKRKCNSEAIGGIVERKWIKEWLVCGRRDSTNRMTYKRWSVLYWLAGKGTAYGLYQEKAIPNSSLSCRRTILCFRKPSAETFLFVTNM